MERAFHNWIKSQVQTGDRSSCWHRRRCGRTPKADLGWVVSTDMIAEGAHFESSRHSLDRVGHKLMAVNLSDLAAMGATPVAALLDFLLPREFDFSGSTTNISGLSKGWLTDLMWRLLVAIRMVGTVQLVLEATVLGLEAVTDKGPANLGDERCQSR